MEKGKNLDACLNSVFNQTDLPEKIVLVADGELTEELYSVIEKYKSRNGDRFVFFETEENTGNWFASNKAIELCDTDVIVKLDSDDMLLPSYVEKMRAVFEKGEADICGVCIDEFDDETGESLSIKRTPENHGDIYTYARRRNPFNNPGLAFLKSYADKIGGYRQMERCEDYDFTVRMLMAGAKGKNLPEVLVRYRTDKDNIVRRKNYKNTKWFIISRFRIYKSGFSSLSDFLITVAAQLVLFVMPVGLTKRFYSTIRKK